MKLESELIRPIVKVGNSAVVILPREWLNGRAKIELIAKPLDIKREILEVLDEYLYDIKGIYLVGSYARGEQTDKSDIDLLVITNKLTKMIEKGKYSIMLVSEDVLKKQIEDNVLPILPMVKEAKTLVNDELIKKYKNYGLTKRNLRFHLITTKSILNVIRATLNIDRERGYVRDSSAYSLILRLREIYIIGCIKDNKMWNNKELLSIVRKVSGSLIAYERYVAVKSDRPARNLLPIGEAEKLYKYVYDNIRKQEKWAKEKI